MHREIDMAHVLGMFAKWTAIIVVFGFSPYPKTANLNHMLE